MRKEKKDLEKKMGREKWEMREREGGKIEQRVHTLSYGVCVCMFVFSTL